MRNLAEDSDCDTYIAEELDWANIKVQQHPKPQLGEVPTLLTGFLVKDGKPVFTFRRAWYYWVAVGDVPLAVAQELYANPVGKREVRVTGHCGCPPPEEWVSPSEVDGSPVIDVYHIDGQRGLNLFVETLRKHGLAE